MKQKTNAPQTRILKWILGAPIRCALMTLLSFVLCTAIFIFCMEMFRVTITGAWPLMLIILIAQIYFAWRMMRQLSPQSLDRQSFITIIYGTAITAAIVIILRAIITDLIYWPSIIAMNSPIVPHHILVAFIIGATALLLLKLYCVALAIVILRATYIRARTIGISKWRTILSMPFSMLIPAMWILDDNKTTPNSIHPKWLQRTTSVFTSNKIAAWIALVLVTLISTIAFGTLTLILLTIAFTLWLAIWGTHRTKSEIGGMFAIAAVLINLVTIGYVGTMAAITINNAIETVNSTGNIIR